MLPNDIILMIAEHLELMDVYNLRLCMEFDFDRAAVAADPETTFKHFVDINNLDMVRYVLDNYELSYGMDAICAAGNLEALKCWPEINDKELLLITYYGDYQFIKYCIEDLGFTITDFLLNMLIQTGSCKTLKYVLEKHPSAKFGKKVMEQLLWADEYDKLRVLIDHVGINGIEYNSDGEPL